MYGAVVVLGILGTPLVSASGSDVRAARRRAPRVSQEPHESFPAPSSAWRAVGLTKTTSMVDSLLACSAGRCASSSLRVSISVKSRWARGSPLTAPTASLRMIARCLDKVTVRSPSRRGIGRDPSSRTIFVSGSSRRAGVLDVVPVGRPRGLPDWPGASTEPVRGRRCLPGRARAG